MRVGIATDHGGFSLKDELVARLRAAGHDVVEFGAYALDPADDYPDFVVPLARAVVAGQVERGVAICGSRGWGLDLRRTRSPAHGRRWSPTISRPGRASRTISSTSCAWGPDGWTGRGLGSRSRRFSPPRSAARPAISGVWPRWHCWRGRRPPARAEASRMDLELPPDQMRAMADAVAARCIDLIASLPTPADSRRRRVGGRALPRRCASRRRSRAARSSRCSISSSTSACRRTFNAASGGYLAYIPGGGLYPAAFADFISQLRQPLHRRVDGGAGARAARGQRARLAARLDGVPGDDPRAVHHRRLDGDVQRASCAPASATSAPTSGAACSTPPTRRITRC